MPSGLGNASAIIGLVVVGLDLLLLVITVFLLAAGAFRQEPETARRFGTVLGSINYCAAAPACLTGLILGIISLTQHDRRRTWAVVGVTLNSLVLSGLAIGFVVGLIVAR